jgi:hypothetical protein
MVAVLGNYPTYTRAALIAWQSPNKMMLYELL